MEASGYNYFPSVTLLLRCEKNECIVLPVEMQSHRSAQSPAILKSLTERPQEEFNQLQVNSSRKHEVDSNISIWCQGITWS